MASVQGLECVCPVDAAPVYQFAESLKDQNKTFEDARGDLHNARTTITSSMTSRATDSLIDELDRQIARIDETVTHRQTLIDATMTFHDEIVTCKARFSNIIFQALCNGLTVDDNTIIDPALSGTSQSGAASLSPSRLSRIQRFFGSGRNVSAGLFITDWSLVVARRPPRS